MMSKAKGSGFATANEKFCRRNQLFILKGTIKSIFSRGLKTSTSIVSGDTQTASLQTTRAGFQIFECIETALRI